MTVASPGDWLQQVQDLSNATTERSMASVANVQRLLLAVASAQLTPEALAAALPQFGSPQGAEVYERLARLIATFVAGLQGIVVRGSDEYLTGLLPTGPLAGSTVWSVAPPPPQHAGSAEWAAWYQLFAARAAEQQATLAQRYGALLNEVASGRLAPDVVQSSATEFVQQRAPEYLAELAELSSELLAAALAIADDSVDDLYAVLFGEPPADEIVLEVEGAPGSTSGKGLAVENDRTELAQVFCVVTPATGFGLAADPASFSLGAGGAQTVTVRVTLPAEPAPDYVPAGTVAVRRPGEPDLVVRVRALVEAPPAG